MKKIFEIIGIIGLTLFSFYYTDKIIKLSEEKDTIMVSINEYAKKIETNCIEGKITEEGMILGISGIKVNKKKSYNNMRGIGFNEKDIVYDNIECIVNEKRNIDRYIIQGNRYKNAVSLLIYIDNVYYLENFYEKIKSTNVNIDLIVNLNTLKSQKEILTKYYMLGNNILYNDQEKIEEFKKEIKSINNKINTYCVSIKSEIIDECKAEKINSIKTNKIYEKNMFLNISKSLEKGDLIILFLNKELLESYTTIIKYIESKGINVLKVEDHFK